MLFYKILFGEELQKKCLICVSWALNIDKILIQTNNKPYFVNIDSLSHRTRYCKNATFWFNIM